MGVWRLVRLQFGRCPAHFGELGIGMEASSERMRSDSLFSAWLSAYARLQSKETVSALIDQFKSESPPFQLSSTFIYHSYNNECVYYLPRPLKPPLGFSHDDQVKFNKPFKALKYLPLSIWQRWYQGKGFTESDRQELSGNSQHKALANAGLFNYDDAYKIHQVPRSSIDRTTRATNLYHTGFVQYHWQPNPAAPDRIESLSGLYFLVHFPSPDPELEQLFFKVLNFLGSEGIGGERSSGAGQFHVDLNATRELPTQWQQVIDYAAGQSYSLLSLFWQKSLSTEMLHNASYSLQERGGWITSPASDGRQQRRKSVQMFTEGSVFQRLPVGHLADVTPTEFTDHSIYRSGISLSLPLNVQENHEQENGND
ncbi:type III-A CRISPR-associated RAMP protein Csm4 [filamentous cyanobacterium CCP1]|nr:type III-A CRISPR-associated RAMP protein Csm4 [filamentous cyanobacterium CCP2]PSB67763.1 type III-A CRISPR-associated RAMP protein Csm4 [filamentous cyanobacterium CCP1]